MTTYMLTGTVLDEATHQRVSGARVEAWDAENIYRDMVGFAVADTDGKFRMRVTDLDVQAAFGDRPPIVFFPRWGRDRR